MWHFFYEPDFLPLKYVEKPKFFNNIETTKFGTRETLYFRSQIELLYNISVTKIRTEPKSGETRLKFSPENMH